MRMHNLVMAAATVAALSAGMDHAAAQPADSKAAAEQLFNQGRDLMKQGDAEAACPKFEASLEIDPALGTLLNLANCYEQSGRLASAWARYRELADLAAREDQPKRQQFARERAAALEPRLPGLVIRVSDGARVPGLTVTRDGTAVDRALLGSAVYVDPGEHEVVATAPGHERFSTTVTAVEAEESTVEIPALAPVAEEVDDVAAGGLGGGGEADGAILHASGARDAGRTRRTLGLATGGVGVAVLVGGLGLGWSAISTWNDAFDSGLCDRDMLMCTPEGQSQTSSARGKATVSTVLVGAGVGLAAAGVILYMTAPDAGFAAAPERRATRLVPVAGPDALGLALSGNF